MSNVRWTHWTALLLAVLLLAGCVFPTAAPAEPGAAAPPAAEEGAAETAPAEEAAAPAEGATTLTMWDIHSRDVESAVVEAVIAAFEEAHPGVDVVRSVKSYDDMRATAKLALGAADGPDVAMVNQSRVDMGAMVEAGLLLDLTPYAEQYGWNDFLPAAIAKRNSFTPDGKTFGAGNLYGVPEQAEFIAVFYNKEILEANGIALPATFDEFEAALATLKEAGVTPIVFGNLDGWPAIHTFGELQNLYATQEYVDNYIFGQGDVSFNSPETVQAAEKLVEWENAGYFTEGYEGIGYDDSWKLFGDGQGAFMITGSWISGELLAREDADKFGLFLLPGLEAGAPKLTVGGTNMGYSIRATSANPDLAAELIDMLVGEQAAAEWAAAAFFPLRPVDPESVEQAQIFEDGLAAWAAINENNVLGHYLDWASPTMYDTITAALQELLAGAAGPQEFAEKVNADYQAFMSELE